MSNGYFSTNLWSFPIILLPKTAVISPPITIIAIVTARVNVHPPQRIITGMKKVPMTAPDFPMLAAMPLPVPRSATGYICEGNIKVIKWGPALRNNSNIINPVMAIHDAQPNL